MVAAVSAFLAAGPVQSAGAHDCALCVHFATSFDPDGTAGPAAAKKRMHHAVVANVPYALDVNGTKPPLPLGLLPTLPGYEVSATVLGISAETPTIKIQKLLGAPQPLPLRIEVVTGNVGSASAKKTTFGYDTLDSTAPGSFSAAIDIRDTDNNPATDRAALDLQIGNPGRTLGVVNEEFTGDPIGNRSDRHIRRGKFIAGGTPATAVPSMASLLVETSNTRQSIRLTADKRSKAEFELSEPSGDSTTGSISDLPLSTRVTVTDTDADGDGVVDKVIDYQASHRVGHAEVESFDGVTGLLTSVGVDNLPKQVHVVYGNPPGQTKITYSASERAGRAQVDVTGGDVDVRGILENVPTAITELTHTSNVDGSGKVVYHANARADLAEVRTFDGARELVATAETPPANIEELTYATPPNLVTLDYIADATTPHVDVSVDQLIFGNGTPQDPDHQRKIAAGIDDFPREFTFDLATPPGADTTADYSSSDPMTKVTLTADDDEVPVVGRGKALDLVLETLPLAMHAAFGQDSVLVDPLGGKIGKSTFLAQRERPAVPAPDPFGDPEQDGIFMDDDPEGTDAYVLLARVHDLRKLETDTSPDLSALLDTDSDPLRSFDIDLHYPTADFNETQRLTGTLDGLRPGTEIFVGAESADTSLVSYDDTATGEGPSISLDGSNLEWLPTGGNGVAAEEFHLDLTGLPRHLAYRQATDKSLPEAERNGMPIDIETSGGAIDRADVQITSGPDDRLPNETDNGYLLRDLANDRFVIFARMRNLESFHTDRPTEDEFELSLDAPDSGRAVIDVVKDVSDQLWESFSTRPGTQTLGGELSSVPPNAELYSRSQTDPTEKELVYTADDTASSFTFNDITHYRGPELESIVDYKNNFLDDHVPSNFEPSDFDSSQTLALTPMPSSFRVCQMASGNDCTSDVFTGADFSEFSPTSANGGSTRFQASPRTHFSFHDDSPDRVKFFYNRVNEEPPDGCQAGEQPGPNTTDPSMPLDCSGDDIKPGRATADIELDLNDLAIQSHQEDAGFVGSLVGYPDQGYIAMDTGWESDFVSCEDAAVEAGFDPVICASPAFAGAHGHHFAPLDQIVTGDVEKGGSLNMASEGSASWENDFDRISGVIDAIDLQFGAHLALDHRVFEGDPDELIFAKTSSGHAYCESDTILTGGGSNFTDDFCGHGEFAFLLGDP